MLMNMRVYLSLCILVLFASQAAALEIEAEVQGDGPVVGIHPTVISHPFDRVDKVSTQQPLTSIQTKVLPSPKIEVVVSGGSRSTGTPNLASVRTALLQLEASINQARGADSRLVASFSEDLKQYIKSAAVLSGDALRLLTGDALKAYKSEFAAITELVHASTLDATGQAKLRGLRKAFADKYFLGADKGNKLALELTTLFLTVPQEVALQLLDLRIQHATNNVVSAARINSQFTAQLIRDPAKRATQEQLERTAQQQLEADLKKSNVDLKDYTVQVIASQLRSRAQDWIKSSLTSLSEADLAEVLNRVKVSITTAEQKLTLGSDSPAASRFRQHKLRQKFFTQHVLDAMAEAKGEARMDVSTPRPLTGGVSTSLQSIAHGVTYGTLGAIMVDGTGQRYALSNQHVFPNDDVMCQPGLLAFQTGNAVPDCHTHASQCCPVANRVGRQIVSHAGTDSALSKIDSAFATTCSVPIIGNVAGRRPFAVGQVNVEKYGARTHHTTGAALLGVDAAGSPTARMFSMATTLFPTFANTNRVNAGGAAPARWSPTNEAEYFQEKRDEIADKIVASSWRYRWIGGRANAYAVFDGLYNRDMVWLLADAGDSGSIFFEAGTQLATTLMARGAWMLEDGTSCLPADRQRDAYGTDWCQMRMIIFGDEIGNVVAELNNEIDTKFNQYAWHYNQMLIGGPLVPLPAGVDHAIVLGFVAAMAGGGNLAAIRASRHVDVCGAGAMAVGNTAFNAAGNLRWPLQTCCN